MNKVKLNVVKQVKVDGRNNNTGRPVNKKSSRQIRLAKQKYYTSQHNKFVNGNTFKINNSDTNTYTYTEGDNNGGDGYISNGLTHVCNINYVGRTKVLGYTFVLGRKVNVAINLKNVTF
tara:strand:+ start:61 stop:417 length:357 start_codon:yes stop_codon:yes gene_type:complete